jgi:1-acyl-sn-glycerol-3-phosphate acyltransferase
MSDLTYRVVIGGCRALLRLLGLRVEVRGAERLPRRGPVVLAANHHSFVDFMLVGLVGRLRGRFVRFLAKQVVFELPVVGSVMRAMGHIPVDRAHGQVAARRTLRALGDGQVVGIYPEATIGRAFTVRDRPYWRRGAAYLALATGAPVVPVAHFGAHRVATVGGRFSLRRGAAVTVLVGEPLVPLAGETADELTTRLRARIADMVEELTATYPQPPRAPRATWWWPAHRGGGAPEGQTVGALEESAVGTSDARR